ncbi:hypothetical protein [Halanaerobium salsuginis]|jgi:predicted RNA-binding Zn-ribbon protein involved in translation (DUF1610 family)|uniref:Uncharacterized protein n=1 Tax=Halanaerobium salsuginis TaxID=29563 RepID=A0A1I4FKH7_9FIRM|nr:hypothetical protein [Halanaerobium salsuginis]SFL17417.1 hypothetical protein SAMN02983006_00363 [Halanaerobium salsuginis]
MLINISTTIALSCPACGRLEREKINIFELPVAETKKLSCSCGAEKAALQRQANNYLGLSYFCLHCDQAHKLLISPQKFWYSKNLTSLSCKETGLNLGFFGPSKLVENELEKVKKDLELMAEEMGLDDFKDPDLMLQALDIIHDIAAEQELYCECGSHDINIELFSDKIQLICNNCGSQLDIAARSETDLQKLRQLNRIELQAVQGKSKNSLDPWINI